MYLCEIKEKMAEENSKESGRSYYANISDYIVSQVIPEKEVNGYYYETNLSKEWVLIVTDYAGTYRVKRDRISSFTDYGNDCLSIRMNKGVYLYIPVVNLTAITFERQEVTSWM